MDFVAIDFETANNAPYSACAVGIVSMSDGIITDEYYSLIQPPQNYYSYFNSKVHGIYPHHTQDSLFFPDVFTEIKARLIDKKVIAHNEGFDRNVLLSSLMYYEMFEPDLNLRHRWDCTVKIYRKKQEGKANLRACCDRHDIVLDHHNALSDARACALLYWKHKSPLFA